MENPKSTVEEERHEPSLLERSKPAVLCEVFKVMISNILEKGNLKFTLKALAESQKMGLNYLLRFNITPTEAVRYFGKCIFLAYSYVGFNVNGTEEEAKGAGKAAVLTTLYDVASDWRDNSDPKWREILKSIFEVEFSEELREIAMRLFDRDVNGNLENDGLERGAVTLKVILELMGITKEYEKKADLQKVGTLLQIVDDVLDYEEDIACGDQNCLVSDQKEEHLQTLIEGFSDEELERLFKPNTVLVTVIKSAREKARQMLQ